MKKTINYDPTIESAANDLNNYDPEDVNEVFGS